MSFCLQNGRALSISTKEDSLLRRQRCVLHFFERPQLDKPLISYTDGIERAVDIDFEFWKGESSYNTQSRFRILCRDKQHSDERSVMAEMMVCTSYESRAIPVVVYRRFQCILQSGWVCPPDATLAMGWVRSLRAEKVQDCLYRASREV